MVVDEDSATLAALSSLLRPWGLQVTSLNEPQRFWEVLTATARDLLVLDLEMPTFSGFDLCQVVRQDPQWGDLPILVVTAHTDAESIQRVFAAGADDFICKPVVVSCYLIGGLLEDFRSPPQAASPEGLHSYGLTSG